jgi:hypothetical protein
MQQKESTTTNIHHKLELILSSNHPVFPVVDTDVRESNQGV